MATTRALVTGASGLVGSHLVDALLKRGMHVKAVVHSRASPFKETNNLEVVRGDLTKSDFCNSICKGIDQAYHLAVETGGIMKNAKHPASTMTPTILMDFNMLKAAHDEGVERYLYSSCACIYPLEEEEMREENAWSGPPPEMHKTISWSKRISELQCQSFYKEFGDKIAIVRPSNTYGPNDVFDVNNSHVIPTFIKKAIERTDPFVIWGNGEQIREFVYAQDVAEGIVLALQDYAVADPINLGGGTAIQMKELARLIASLSGYVPEIKFDLTKPSGHMKRVLISEKAEKTLGFRPKIALEEGLRRTIEWYKSQL